MKQKIAPVLLILSAFFLFACGLTDITMGDETQVVSTPQEETVAVETGGEQEESEPTEKMEESTPTESANLDT